MQARFPVTIGVDIPSQESDSRYRQFDKRVDFLLKKAYQESPLFSYKFKIVTCAGIVFYIAKMDAEHIIPGTRAAFLEEVNRIVIYPKLCFENDDISITDTLIHECNHAFKTTIHKMRCSVTQTPIETKYAEEVKENIHALPFYPYNSSEQTKYQELIDKGVDRVYDFAYLLQKDKSVEKLLPQEQERLEKYKMASQGHVIRLHKVLYPYGDKLSDERLIQAINLGQKKYFVEYFYRRNNNQYKVVLEVCKIEKMENKLRLFGYYQLTVNQFLPKGEEKKYCAFIGEILTRDMQIGDGYKKHEILAEYHARIFSELTEREIMCFFPEMMEYDDLDAQQALSVGRQNVYGSVYASWRERAAKDPQLYRSYANIPNPSFALQLQEFFNHRNARVTVSSYYQNPTRSTAELEAYNVDIVCQAQTGESFRRLQFFFSPINQRTELHPATKEVVIKSINVEPEALLSFRSRLE